MTLGGGHGFFNKTLGGGHVFFSRLVGKTPAPPPTTFKTTFPYLLIDPNREDKMTKEIFDNEPHINNANLGYKLHDCFREVARLDGVFDSATRFLSCFRDVIKFMWC